MRLTDPMLFDFSDPLAKYEAHSFALLVDSVPLTELSALQRGNHTRRNTEWLTAAYARHFRRLGATAESAKEYWIFVVRDLDLEIPLPTWEGDLFHDGGMMAEERKRIKCELKGRGRIVAMSEWSLKPSDWIHKDELRAEEGRARVEAIEKETGRKMLARPKTGNTELQEHFMEKIIDMRKKLVGGQAHYMLENLYTAATHTNRGLGQKLTQTMIPLTDSRVQCYLDASPMGYGIYLKCGFKEIDHIEIDLTKYGGTTLHRHAGMIRPPVENGGKD